MKVLTLALLLLLFSPLTFSQPKAIVEDKGNFGLHVVNDSIMWHKYLEDKNELLLIGRKNIQLLDRLVERRQDALRVQLEWPIRFALESD